MKRNFLILYAIIAVAVVVIPTTYFELTKETALPGIEAKNNSSTYSWKANFDNVSSFSPLLRYGMFSNSTFQEQGYPNSSLNVGLGVVEYYDKAENALVTIFFLNVSGSVSMSVLPDLVNVTYTPPSIYDPIPGTIEGKSVTWGFLQPENVSPVGFERWTSTPTQFNEELLNRSSGNGLPYHFAFTSKNAYWLVPPGNDVPFPFSVNVSLEGLSRPVYSSIVLSLNDTGNLFGGSAGSVNGGYNRSQHVPSVSSPTTLSGLISTTDPVSPYQMYGYILNSHPFATIKS
jgi:hypothetical protein